MAIIKNIKRLATTPLRADALAICEAGYEALRVSTIIESQLKLTGTKLQIGKLSYDLSKYRHIYVVGVGKGSALAAQSIEKTLGPKRIASGYVIDIVRKRLKKIRSLRGTHPLPSEQNIAATEKVIELLKKATQDDLVLTVICGGGSSLFCSPGGMSCTDLQLVSDQLLKSGANIGQINTVRKHLSRIHGGFMAQYAYPAKLVSLIISDVVGDNLGVIASGPTVLDHTTVQDAQKVAEQFGLPSLTFTETPKDTKLFNKVDTLILANGSRAVEAMSKRAEELGYTSRTYSTKVSGLASSVGPTLAQSVRAGEALLGCGETQVVVTHPGKGGRNQDVALSATPFLAKHSVIISAASDGKDNIPVAGGITDSDWAGRQLSRKHISPESAVEQNQSYKVLRKIRGLLQIRKVTANVSDFYVVLRGKHE